MCEQITMWPPPGEDENFDKLVLQAETLMDFAKQEKAKKKKWENAFQKWSDNHGMQEDCIESWGSCGYGSMCDWCEDNSFGRPCVRALNAMCREKHIIINYEDYDFTKIW